MTIETAAINYARAFKDRRVRVRCPKCKRLRYGERKHYYDTTRDFLECGVMLDYGYGCWAIDKPEVSRVWHGKKQK